MSGLERPAGPDRFQEGRIPERHAYGRGRREHTRALAALLQIVGQHGLDLDQGLAGARESLAPAKASVRRAPTTRASSSSRVNMRPGGGP